MKIIKDGELERATENKTGYELSIMKLSDSYMEVHYGSHFAFCLESFHNSKKQINKKEYENPLVKLLGSISS